MKYVHWITIRVFLEASEDSVKTKEALSTLVGKEKANNPLIKQQQLITPQEAQKTPDATPLNMLLIKLTKQQQIKYVIKQLHENLSQEQRNILISQNDRVDEQCRFFLRLKKEAFVNHQKYIVTQRGSCIHFTFLIASYPANKNNALKVVKELFS